jgi:predicted HicB family RNase H-like nuclease
MNSKQQKTDVIMEYKGYTAIVRYSEDDTCYVGQITGINDIVVFDGETLDAIRKTFEEDVDSYSECCAELGREPNKPVAEIMVPIPPALYAKIASRAEYDGIPVNTLMESVLQKFVQHA